MIHKHYSVNHVLISHPNILPFSKSTFYKYIELDILNIRNIDLQRKVSSKINKEYSNNLRPKCNPEIKIDRFYSNFKD